MRPRSLSHAALQATALLAILGGGGALRAQPSSDLRWDRQGFFAHTAQSLLNTVVGSSQGNWSGADDTENDEVGDPDIAAVQSLHYFSESAPGGTGNGGGGTGGTGFGEVYSYAAGIAELNPDEQPLLSWSVIHDQISYTDLEGGGGGGGGNGTGGNGGAGGASGVGWNRLISGINCNAVLEVVPMGNPAATTQGTIEVDLAWSHVDVPDAEIPGATGAGASGSLPWDRPVAMFVSVGDAALTITGGGGGAMTIVYQGDTDPFPVVINGTGTSTGTVGTMFLGRGNCVDTTMAAGATASMNGTMESQFGAAGNAPGGGGGAGFPGAPGGDGGDGGGAGGGSAGTNGSPGGAGDHAEYTTQGTFQGWIGVFAGW